MGKTGRSNVCRDSKPKTVGVTITEVVTVLRDCQTTLRSYLETGKIDSRFV